MGRVNDLSSLTNAIDRLTRTNLIGRQAWRWLTNLVFFSRESYVLVVPRVTNPCCRERYYALVPHE